MHSIKKLDVELKLSATLSKETAKDEAKNLYEGFFHDAIERAVVSFPEEKELIIDNIEIDLGPITPSDIPGAIEKRLVDEISSRMRHAEVAEGVKVTGYRNGFTHSTIVSDAETNSEMRTRAMEKAFYKYLLSGYADMTILGDHYSSKDLCALVFRNILKSPDYIGQFVSLIRGAMPAFFRFIDIVEEEELKSFVEQLWPKRYQLPTLRMADSIRLVFMALIYLEQDIPVSIMNGGTSSGNAANFPWQEAVMETEGGFASTASVLVERLRDDYSTYLSPSRTISLLRNFFAMKPVISSSALSSSSSLSSPPSSALSNEVGPKSELLIINNSGQTEERTESEVDHENRNVIYPESLFESGLRIHLDDAGLVLITPFLKQLFSALHYLNERYEFLSPVLQARSVHILRYIATGSPDRQMEENLVLEKILCGLPVDFPSGVEFKLNSREYEEIGNLYSTLLNYWNPFKEKSINSLRQAFLMRKGTIERDEASWIVRIEGKGVDILMDGIPWGYSTVSLPWAGLFYIDWQ